jgi:hypothetical protein
MIMHIVYLLIVNLCVHSPINLFLNKIIIVNPYLCCYSNHLACYRVRASSISAFDCAVVRTSQVFKRYSKWGLMWQVSKHFNHKYYEYGDQLQLVITISLRHS